jgi:type IV pilus assembly protein PilC
MKKLKIKEQARALKQTARLLKGGIPLVKAMEVAGFPDEAVEMVSAGGGISASIAPYFSGSVPGLLEIGERSGELEEMFGKAAEGLERQDDFRKKLSKALSYPMIVLSVSLLSMAAFIYLGIPKMKEIFGSFALPLPGTLVIMDGISAMIIPLAAAAAGLAAALNICSRRRIFLRQKESVKYGLPLLGAVAVKLETSMILRNLSVLLRSGMPLAQSLEQAKRSVKPVLFREMLDRVRDKISAGQKISAAFGQEKYFDRNTVKMIEAAEEAAYLDKVFESAADILEEEAHDSIRSFTLLIEPLSTVFVGAVVGFVVVSMFSPMMKILESL